MIDEPRCNLCHGPDPVHQWFRIRYCERCQGVIDQLVSAPLRVLKIATPRVPYRWCKTTDCPNIAMPKKRGLALYCSVCSQDRHIDVLRRQALERKARSKLRKAA